MASETASVAAATTTAVAAPGLMQYIFGGVLGGGLLTSGVLYWWQSRVRVREAKDLGAIQAEATAAQTPFQLLQQQLLVKDNQLAAANQEYKEFVDSAMARNDATTRAILELASLCRQQTENLKQISADVQTHRKDSSERAGKIYEKISDVNERLAGVEAGIKNSLETAQEAVKKAKEAAETAEKVVKEARGA